MHTLVDLGMCGARIGLQCILHNYRCLPAMNELTAKRRQMNECGVCLSC